MLDYFHTLCFSMIDQHQITYANTAWEFIYVTGLQLPCEVCIFSWVVQVTSWGFQNVIWYGFNVLASYYILKCRNVPPLAHTPHHRTQRMLFMVSHLMLLSTNRGNSLSRINDNWFCRLWLLQRKSTALPWKIDKKARFVIEQLNKIATARQ